MTDTQTVDITLAYADWLTQARASKGLPLWFKHRALFQARICEIGESGGFHQRHDSLVETVAYHDHQHPASHRTRYTYYAESRLPLSRPDTFTNHSASYPLDHTVRVDVCGRCHGRGHVSCRSCSGSGTCRSCGGSGQSGSGETRTSCSSCSGGRCRSCGGRGRKTCSTCSGEGRVLRFTSKDYTWRHHVDEEAILQAHTDRGATREMIEESVAQRGAVPVAAFALDEVRALVGVVNQRVRDVVAMAADKEQAMQTTVQARGHVLRHDIARHYVPMGFLNVQMGTAYGQFFAAGSQRHVTTVRPPLPWCPWRVGFWVTLLLAAVLFGLAKGALIQVAPEELPWVWALPGLAFAAALTAWIVDRRTPRPPLWLVFDDAEGHGWPFCRRFTETLATAGVARVEDPFYAALLDETRDDLKSRNSFMCTLHSLTDARALEWLYLTGHGHAHFREQASALLERAARLTWHSDREAADLDDEIVHRLAVLQVRRLPVPDIWLIGTRGRTYTADQFPKLTALAGAPPKILHEPAADAPLPPDLLDPWL